MRRVILLVFSVLIFEKMPAEPATAQIIRGEAVELSLLDEKPKLIASVAPVYPFEQSKAGLGGRVKVEFIIDVNGRTYDARVVQSNNPAFERPALDAVRQWKFKPGVFQGKPVDVRAVQEIEFSTDDNGTDGLWRVSKPKDQSHLPAILQWDVAPIPTDTTFPVYPYEALLGGVKGETKLRFVVDTTGRVIESKIDAATTPELGLAALAMIETWRFTPPKKKNGTLCDAALTIDHTFSPKGHSDIPVSASARRILRLLEKHPEEIVAADQLDRPLKPFTRRVPVYPLALKQTTDSGEAVIEFFIDEDGDAQLPRIISSTAPAFGYAAVQAVAAWRFEPPIKNGKTVITRARVPLKFKHSAPTPAHS